MKYAMTISILFALAANSTVLAQETPPPQPTITAEPTITIEPAITTEPALEPTTESPPPPAPSEPRAPRTSKAFGARLETDPPGYVKPMSEHGKEYGVDAWQELNWLDFGLEHRTQFELRDDYYTRGAPELRDEQFLLRSRAYLGVREVFDPFRFGFEFQDARQYMSDFPEDNGAVDEADVLQLFGELYFKDAIGPGLPLRIQAGRMTFDYIDRKLVARNRFRNATNAFDGIRFQLGQPSADWQFDVLAVMPVERRMRQPDRSDEERWLYGMVGAWRGWSDVVTLEPYYFILDEDRTDPTRADREIHTLGLHAFGPIGTTAFDYDLDAAFQFGDDGERNQHAFATYGELGYTFKHEWKPRLSVSGTYGSGDRHPDDGTTERFDRLFAANHYRSASDMFNWQNIISPKLRLECRPLKKLRVDGSYGAYWLASDSDAWVTPGRRDPQGESGDFIGQELEVRARYELHEHAELETGYSYFIPGAFVENTGPADDTDFFYLSLTLTF